MTPRRRSDKKRGWPANLYEEDGYFSWRHPRTGQKFGLGRISKTEAFNEAVIANLHVAAEHPPVPLVARLTGDSQRTVQTWAQKFEKILTKRKVSKNTRIMYASWVKRFRSEFEDETPVAGITALKVSETLEAIEEKTPVAAKQLRRFWHEMFREAELAGWIPKNENPVRDVRTRRVGVRRARLTFEVFQQVYGRTRYPWLKNAMALALVSGQRREDIAGARFSDVRDGHWYVHQSKTKARIAIPLEIRLDAFGASLADVVKQCRGTGVLSKHLVHQTVRHGRSRPGAPFSLLRISKAFTDEISALAMDWGDRTHPTFHEIRSLAKRMYGRQGNVNTKDLLGHRTESTSELYEDGRGAPEWTMVKISAGKGGAQ